MKRLEPDGFSVLPASPGFLSLRMADGTVHEDVRCAALFPVTDPEGFVELTVPKPADEGGQVSLGVLQSMAGLEPAARAAIEAALRRRHMLPEITEIRSIRDGIDGCEWDVETDRGARRMLVKRKGESYQMIGENRLVVEDADGCRYRISDIRALSPRSRFELDKVLV